MKYLLCFLMLLSCGPSDNANKDSKSSTVSTAPMNTDELPIGWYFLGEKGKGLERKLKGTEEVYYIIPQAIVTVDHFTGLEMYEEARGVYSLAISLNRKGAKAWSEATLQSMGKKLALIVGDELIHNMEIKSQVTLGITALRRADLSEQELKTIKAIIESRMK